MSAIAPIVITDGLSTPVSHTFNPSQAVPTAEYAEDGLDLPLIAEPTISLNVNRMSSGMSTVRGVLRLPVQEVPDGGTGSGYVAAPTVAYFVQGSFEFKIPARSSVDERTVVRTLLAALLGNSQVIDAVDNLRKPY